MAETDVSSTTTPATDSDAGIFLDEQGQPVDQRVGLVLRRLAPQLARQFAHLREESLLVESLEQAAYRIRRRETRVGEVANLDAYAWVTLVSIANSLLRRGRSRVLRRSTSELTRSLLNIASSTMGSAEHIERAILIRELLDHLSPLERAVYQARLEGRSSHEIARRRGCTRATIDILLTRARQKLRVLVNPQHATGPRPAVLPRGSERPRRRRRRYRGVPVQVLTKIAKPRRALEL